MSTGDFYPSPKDPLARWLVRSPDGGVVSLRDSLRQRHDQPEAEISKNVLKAGDIVALSCGEDPDNPNLISFEVTESTWVGLSDEPTKQTIGKIQGLEVPADLQNKPVGFMGSGWGGRSLRPGLLATGMFPYFRVLGEVGRSEVILPALSDFQVFRPNGEGVLELVEPQMIDRGNRLVSPEHERRLIKVGQLMEQLDFDFNILDFEARTGGDYPFKETDHFAATYTAGGATGNTLTVYDKATRGWHQMTFFNWAGEDLFQYKVSNLDRPFEDLYYLAAYHPSPMKKIAFGSSEISRADLGMTTLVTSRRYGIDAIDFKPSAAETKAFQIPQLLWEDGRMVCPHIQIQKDGSTMIDASSFPLNVINRDNPGTLEEILAKTRFDKNQQILYIGERAIPIVDAEQELDKLAELIRQ